MLVLRIAYEAFRFFRQSNRSILFSVPSESLLFDSRRYQGNLVPLLRPNRQRSQFFHRTRRLQDFPGLADYREPLNPESLISELTSESVSSDVFEPVRLEYTVAQELFAVFDREHNDAGV
uniref:Uncharacterized protein n=1 Tax=Vespula pensylvanica TaxID=30213 RepID=A0A834P4H9_VESPE|nr:hypothetical protein H0235_007321 [Vespula pensylvanica]